MKRLMVAALLVLAMTGLASATVSIRLTVGADSITIADASGLDINGIAGKVAYSVGDFHGWEVDFVAGTTHAPSLSPFGLDLASVVATCVAGSPCTSTPLHVILSDTGFTQPTSNFAMGYSSSPMGNLGSTSQSGYVSLANSLFDEATLIGTVGPLVGGGIGSVVGGGAAGPAAYALTLDQLFQATRDGASFSTDGSVTASVPEPASMALFGSVLVFCAARLRKRFA
jgi:hypothetical protein